MSKAEDYIRENTKSYSNGWYDDLSQGYEPWLTPYQAREAVRIATKDIVNKISFYIENTVSDITFSDIDGQDNYDLKVFIEDLKQLIEND